MHTKIVKNRIYYVHIYKIKLFSKKVKKKCPEHGIIQ